MAAFGLSFAAISEESQLHGTINGQSSLSSSSGSLSNNSTDRSPSSGLPTAATASVPAPVPAISQSSASSASLVTCSSVTTVSSNSPITVVPSTSPSFKPASSYESHSRLIAGYPRLPGFYSSTYSADQNSLYPANSASFYPSLNYDLDKPNGNSWTPLASQTPYSPYDHSFYSPYSNCYGTIDSAARRKNATRETTNTLKAWLYEHRKNPYPTKGEKIMLAIITKMTLTQVSTWFANARRRLKKENKMTWEPKNKASENRDDSDKDSSKDIDDDDDNMSNDKSLDNGNGMRRTGIKLEERSPDPAQHSAHHNAHQTLLNHHHQNSNTGGGSNVPVNSAAAVTAFSKTSHLLSNHGGNLGHHHHHHSHLGQQPNGPQSDPLHGHHLPHHHHHQHHHQAALPPLLPFGPASLSLDNDSLDRPKIWSLAQTATSAEATNLAAAARLYPEWSAAYAFQHQSGANAADNMLINPFPDHYPHHHHHGSSNSNNNNSSNHSTATVPTAAAGQSVQSLPGTNGANFYGKSTLNGSTAPASVPPLPLQPAPVTSTNSSNSWTTNDEPQSHNLHQLGGGAGGRPNGHANGTFACSSVSFLSDRGNSVMTSPFTPATVAASIQQHQFFLSQQQKHRTQISTT